MPNALSDKSFEVILGNANKRFSGVTSTMLQNYEHQAKHIGVRILGAHHLPDKSINIRFYQLAWIAKTHLDNGYFRVFHARRNIEMVQALLLKYLFRAKIRILFTSTAQRHHSSFTQYLMKKMDMVISTCSAAASYLCPPPAYIVPHGIQLNIYKPVHEPLIKDDTINIAIFGRVRPQKGTHLFIHACLDALPKYPKAHAQIIGAITPDNEHFVKELKQEIENAGLSHRIQFLGEQKFEDIPILFQQSHIVAALSDKEGFGLTVLEAMASGAAVLATKAGAWPEIVRQGKDGFIVEVNNQGSITQQLETMLDKPEMIKTMSSNARQRVEQKYNIELEASRLCEIYRELQHPDYTRIES